MSVREAHHGPTRKTSRQNSSHQSQISLLNQTLNHQHQQTIKLDQDEATAPYFYNEISDVMRGFGDCDHPLRGTVILVEKILHQQLKAILNDVTEVAIRRKGVPCPTQSDFEFLMRKNPIRISRMRKHMKHMKLLRMIKMQAVRPLQQSASGASLISNVGIAGINNSTACTSTDDIDSNQDSDDENDVEISEKFDEEKNRRLFRADRISQILTDKQYQEFNEARRTSFYSRHTEKMKQKFHLFLSIPYDVRLTNSCLNVLAYLAHETIATIVDFAILTRLNSENRITDPFSRVMSSGASFSMLHLCPEVTQGRGLDGVKPITVREVQEAMRRFNQFTARGIGFYRNSVDSDMRKCYLAI